MRTHQLKILPTYFEAVVSGAKTFEIRINDRDYRVGDYLCLCEWNQEYKGQGIVRRISYILNLAEKHTAENYVVLALRCVDSDETRSAIEHQL